MLKGTTRKNAQRVIIHLPSQDKVVIAILCMLLVIILPPWHILELKTIRAFAILVSIVQRC